MPQTPSTRWCPTPEQLMILEEMYRSGVRTPNAAEIQQITAHLAFYGRIEGKNVFYWFQNHKARERQRLRRRLCARHQAVAAAAAAQQQQQLQYAQASASATAPPNPNAATTSSSAHLHPHTSSPHSFMPQGYFQDAAAAPHQGLDLVGKIGECTDLDAVACGAYDQEWVEMMGGGSGSAVPPCCRPPKTLELFPTKSTGLKDECSSSKSSSCSTSTN